MGLGLSPEQITAQEVTPSVTTPDLPVDRKDKIRELKFALKGAKAELQILVARDVPTDEEEKKKFGNEVAQMRAIVMALADELQTTRMNKTGSKFFEFVPSGPNRRTRKIFAKNRTLSFKKR